MATGNALIIVDVQNDFMPGSTYPVPNGNDVVAPINALLSYARKNAWLIVFSRDWHPREMPGAKHCIEDTDGAKFHTELKVDPGDIIISKGNRDLSDHHYSAFNGDTISLRDVLRIHSIATVYIAGLALDYCVKNTALDAKKFGFETSVILDACRAVNKNGVTEQQSLTEMKNNGIAFIASNVLLSS